MTDLPTRERRPGGGGVGSRNEAPAGELHDDNTRNRQLVSTEIEIKALSRGLAALIEAAIEIKDVLDGDTDLKPEEDHGVEDEAHGAVDEHNDAELGWANEGSQLRLHGDGSGVDREPTLGANGCTNGTDHLRGWKVLPTN
jgi:hypothetical protein